MEGRKATVTSFLLPLEHGGVGPGRARRVPRGITAHKKLDYARLIDAAEEGEESLALGLPGRRTDADGEISIYLLVGRIAFQEKHGARGQYLTRKWSRKWQNPGDITH